MFEQDRIRIAGKPVTETKAMRDVYADTPIELAGQDGHIVILDADLMNSIGTVPFARAYPEHSFNCSIQGTNMIGAAAGMSAVGLMPFTHTFDCFTSQRVANQVLTSCVYAELNAKIIDSDPGITAAYNDGTHIALEDCTIMRSIPGVTIVEPVGSTMLADVLRQAANTPGNFYIRLLRKQAVKVHEEGSIFSFGKAVTLRRGSDISIFVGGICVADVLTAADMLASQGTRAEVVNPFTIEPMDTEGAIASMKKTGAAMTVENHNIIGGLGSVVSEVLTEHCPAPLERLGVHDTFRGVGPVDYLKKRLQTIPEDIVKVALRAINRRQNV